MFQSHRGSGHGVQCPWAEPGPGGLGLSYPLFYPSVSSSLAGREAPDPAGV